MEMVDLTTKNGIVGVSWEISLSLYINMIYIYIYIYVYI